MRRSELVALLLVSLPLSAQEWRERKAEALSLHASRPVEATAATVH